LSVLKFKAVSKQATRIRADTGTLFFMHDATKITSCGKVGACSHKPLSTRNEMLVYTTLNTNQWNYETSRRKYCTKCRANKATVAPYDTRSGNEAGLFYGPRDRTLWQTAYDNTSSFGRSTCTIGS